MQINPSNLFYGIWAELPYKAKAKFFIFELMNGKDFLQGARARFKLKGPFVCEFSSSVQRTRSVVDWFDDTLIYVERLILQLNQEESIGIDVPLKMFNIPVLASVSMASNLLEKFSIKFLSPIVFNALILSMEAFNEKIIDEVTPEQILLGRKIEILNFLDSLGSPLRTIGVPVPDVDTILAKMNSDVLKNNSLSIVNIIGRESNSIESYRFAENGHLVNQVKKFDGSSAFKNYRSPCNRVRGLDPIYFGVRDQGKFLDIFIQNYCRPIPFFRNSSTSVYKGIGTIRYLASPRMFEMKIAKNRCFCHGTKSYSECDGFTDISACYADLPIALTHPNFLGSPRLRSKVIGLHPIIERDLSTMEVEPNLGVLVYANFQFQFSFIMKKNSASVRLRNIRPCLYPFFTMQLIVYPEGFLQYILLVGHWFFTYGKLILMAITMLLSLIYLYQGFSTGNNFSVQKKSQLTKLNGP
ncbi:CD36-like protein 4 [Sarcoptes scabiei]|uniref:Scavenger receptor class B member 1 n=1 Tax=Sarcoptes scabiei TaxID=52283 RepID=A0A132A5K9_SARSC|nr:CD36-like protein 4 [Sarcoptes scabiei]